MRIDQFLYYDMHICMDWRSVKFDWNKARAFLVTAEEGSLSAAARALGMAQPTLVVKLMAWSKNWASFCLNVLVEGYNLHLVV